MTTAGRMRLLSRADGVARCARERFLRQRGVHASGALVLRSRSRSSRRCSWLFPIFRRRSAATTHASLPAHVEVGATCARRHTASSTPTPRCALEICEFYDFGDATSLMRRTGRQRTQGTHGMMAVRRTLSALRRVARVAAVMVDGDPRDGADLVLATAAARPPHSSPILSQSFAFDGHGSRPPSMASAQRRGGGGGGAAAAATSSSRRVAPWDKSPSDAVAPAEAKRLHGLLVRATACMGCTRRQSRRRFSSRPASRISHARALQHHGYGGFERRALHHGDPSSSKRACASRASSRGTASRAQGCRRRADQSAKSRREQHGRQAMTPLRQLCAAPQPARARSSAQRRARSARGLA